MMLKELAEAADMPAAKAHAYLVSFCKLGLMEQDTVTGRYDLGPLALELGLVSLNRLDAVKIATAEMAGLSARIGHSTAIAVWGNYGPVSYTHLDVYKRQAAMLPCEWSCWRCFSA